VDLELSCGLGPLDSRKQNVVGVANASALPSPSICMIARGRAFTMFRPARNFLSGRSVASPARFGGASSSSPPRSLPFSPLAPNVEASDHQLGAGHEHQRQNATTARSALAVFESALQYRSCSSVIPRGCRSSECPVTYSILRLASSPRQNLSSSTIRLSQVRDYPDRRLE